MLKYASIIQVLKKKTHTRVPFKSMAITPRAPIQPGQVSCCWQEDKQKITQDT